MNASVNAAVSPAAAVLPAVGKLLRLRWMITVNNFRRSKLISKIFTILAALVGVGMVGFVFWFTWLA